ncbi:MAG: branched-chain amino acid transaminase [Chloroflexaceae bacterium]|nr:branched-chain amino acid transaminase [Chloroflexaceae bacterium]
MEGFLPIAYFQNQFIPFADAKMSVATHALHYGTGAFGGLRGILDGQNPQKIYLFRLDRHCQRLSQSAKFLHFELPPDKIAQTLIDFVKKNQPTQSFYHSTFCVYVGVGIAPRLHNVEKDFLVYGLVMGDYLSPEGISCRISSWARQEDRSFPLRGKISAAYITSSLAKTEAVESGFDEAILLNSQGKVCEATGMNIFLVRNGQLISPSFDQDILEGINRDSVLTIAQDLGIPTVERPIDKSELYIADEVFLCGTAAKIAPVKKIENYHLPLERPITESLRQILIATLENREPRYQHWVTTVECE